MVCLTPTRSTVIDYIHYYGGNVIISAEPDYYIPTEPPFYIRLVNGSPRVSDRTLYADFVASMPIKSAECLLIGGRKIDCKIWTIIVTSYIYLQLMLQVPMEMCSTKTFLLVPLFFLFKLHQCLGREPKLKGLCTLVSACFVILWLITHYFGCSLL